MAAPETGAQYAYRGEFGLAATHVEGDLLAEMAELDLKPDTPVVVHDFDADRNMVLVEWTDISGNPRITSIPLGEFEQTFEVV